MRETREKILLKALQYFAEHGYQNASLNSIADGIGITKGGIYHYFGSKDELFMECMVMMLDKLKGYTDTAADVEIDLETTLRMMFSFNEIYRMMFESFGIDMQDDYLNFTYLIFTGIRKFPELKKMITDIYSEMRVELVGLLDRFKEQGVVKSEIDTKSTAFEIMAMVEGGLLISAFTPDSDMTETGKHFVKSMMDRICV